MRSTFKIAFHVNKGKEKNGVVPVLGRITINGTIAQFSCKQNIELKLWDAKSNRAVGKSEKAVKLNRALDNIRAQLTKHYQTISDRKSYVNAEMVRNAWQGVVMECDTLLGALDKHNDEFKKRTGKDRSKATLDKYLAVRRHLAAFIKIQYRRSDIHMKEITEDFIKEFSIYLNITLGLFSSTTHLYCIPLKMIVTKAHNSGVIAANPFAYYHVPQEIKERGYLSEGELKIIMTQEFTNPRLEIVRDIFVFACLTGMSYIDIKNLTTDRITTSIDSSKWIVQKREKTNTPYRVKLLDIPLQLIEKYKASRNDNRIFPVPANSSCNLRLKEIARQCGINKYLCFHIARHMVLSFRLITSKLEENYLQ